MLRLRFLNKCGRKIFRAQLFSWLPILYSKYNTSVFVAHGIKSLWLNYQFYFITYKNIVVVHKESWWHHLHTQKINSTTQTWLLFLCSLQVVPLSNTESTTMASPSPKYCLKTAVGPHCVPNRIFSQSRLSHSGNICFNGITWLTIRRDIYCLDLS